MCTCEVCQRADYTREISFSAAPPMAWCGIDHPHTAHLWLQPSGMFAAYTQCPGSTGPKLVPSLLARAQRAEADRDAALSTLLMLLERVGVAEGDKQ